MTPRKRSCFYGVENLVFVRTNNRDIRERCARCEAESEDQQGRERFLSTAAKYRPNIEAG
jgi:hypothetical protein